MELDALVTVNSTPINHVHFVQDTTTPTTSIREKSYEQQFLEVTGKDFNTFYKKYYNKLVWIIQKMNINSIDAEGLANDAFMKAFDKIHMYKPEYNFSTWLFSIGKRMACEYKNQQKKRGILFDASAEDSVDSDPIQFYMKNKMDSVQVDYCSQKLTCMKYEDTLKEIAKLDPKYKRIIELSDIQGKSYNEICNILGIELSTVKNRLHHGRLRIENNLKEKFKLLEENY